MKRLRTYIYESIEDNLIWKIDKYIETSKKDQEFFYKLIEHFNGKSFNQKDVEDFLKTNEFKTLKNFIDFLDDEIHKESTNKDYNYRLMVILKKIFADKEQTLKYLNRQDK